MSRSYPRRIRIESAKCICLQPMWIFLGDGNGLLTKVLSLLFLAHVLYTHVYKHTYIETIQNHWLLSKETMD